MKNLLTFTLIMSGLFFTPASASIIEHISESDPQKNSDNNHTRPELPASQDGITCEYDGSYLIINFEKGEGMASMVLSCVSDGCEMASVNFQASSQFVYYIGEITEPIKVEITTNAGSYYCEIIQ